MGEIRGEALLVPGLDPSQSTILASVKTHCERLLNHTPRFKFFTLHGSTHLDSLFEILALLRKGGIELKNEELYLLSLAICIHDLGMVVPLQDTEIREILDGRPTFPDAVALENYIRETHHERIDVFLDQKLEFLISLGLNPSQLALIIDMQIGSGFLWNANETQDFKSTGVNICREIMGRFPQTKLGVLTGTRHHIPDLAGIPLEFFLRKPVDPADLTTKVRHVLS